MKKNHLYIILFLCLISTVNFSQLTVTYSNTQSICQSSGEIQVNASGGVIPYLYEIISGPVTRIQQGSNVFSGLPSGSYQVTVTDNIGVNTTTSTMVAGNYITPSIIASGTQETCLGNNAEIYVSVSNGKGPFTYSLIAPSPVIVGPQTSDTFMGLPAGNYTVRATDSCGNFVTQALNIIAKSYSNLRDFYTPRSFGYSCDSAYIVPRFQASSSLDDWDVNSNIYVIDYYNSTDTVARGIITDTFKLAHHRLYYVHIADLCGNTDVAYLALELDLNYEKSFRCIDNGHYIAIEAEGFTYGNISYQIISGPITTPIQYNDSIFDSLPSGVYTIEVCDTLCDTCITNVVTIEDLKINSLKHSGGQGCELGMGTLMIDLNQAPVYPTVTVLEAPSNFPYLLPYSVLIASDSKYLFRIRNYTYPPGIYKVSVTDSCGRTDTITDTTGISPMLFEKNISTSLACNGTYTVNINGYYRRSGNQWDMHLLDSSGTIVQSQIPRMLATHPLENTGTDTTFYNRSFINIINPGTYIIRSDFFYYPNVGCSPSYLYDTIILSTTFNPVKIDNILSYICKDSASGQLSIYASGGNSPYSYEIISGPVTRTIQADSNFYNLPIGLYSVRVSDVCGNSTILGAELAEYGIGNIITNYSTCLGDSLYAIADTLPGAIYQWTGPNSFVSNTRGFVINPLTINDTGTYNLNIQFGLCIDTIISFVAKGDTFSPVASCRNAIVYLDGLGTAIIDSNDIDNGSSDNCGISTMILSQSSFTCSDVGLNTVVLTVTDLQGNIDSCTATVTVIDTIKPVASCRNITVYLDGLGTAIIDSNDIDNGSSDNCGISTMILSQNSFTCSDVGLNTVVLTVTDLQGNIDSCTATVTVVDTINPIVSCQNITVYLDGLGNALIDSSDIDNGSNDNCGIAFYSLSETSFDCDDIGLNTVWLKVYDLSGNIDSCQSVVTVLDTVSPTLICSNITVQLNQNGLATIQVSDIDGGTSDNCGVEFYSLSETNFDCSNIGNNTVWLIAIDSSGNIDSCSANILVQDVTPPSIFCIGNQTDTVKEVDCNYVIKDYTSTLDSISDNCSNLNQITFTQTPAVGTIIKVNTIPTTETVMISGIDNAGNLSSCTFDVILYCLEELIIPQFLSPNGDDKNDKWKIKNIEYYPENSVRIFNRYGVMVYKKEQYNNTFEGKSNSDNIGFTLPGDEVLPSGTYFYIVDIEGVSPHNKPYTGYLQIKR